MAPMNYLTKLNTQLQQGFSLLELLTVMVIISLLTLISWPVYQDKIYQGRRTEAKLALMELQQLMNKYFANHQSYEGMRDANDMPLAGPTKVPSVGDRIFYQLRIIETTGNYFRLIAQPVLTGAQGKDPCGAIILESTGRWSYELEAKSC